MEWFIMGRDMHVLCNPSTDAPKSLQIYDDKQTNVISNNTVVSTYDFTISKQHKDATKVQLGGYIVFVDKYRKTKMYTLMSYDGDDITQTWHAEDIGLDLLNESSEKWTEKEPHPIAWYLENRVIGDSGWTIGINEIPQLSRTLSFDGESDTQLTRLGDIANQFDGAEIDFSIEMRGSQVTQQHVNIYKKIGSNVIQDRYVDSVNLISLHSTGTIESLTTALKPFGSEMEVPEGSPEGTEASRVTLYNVKYDDGRYYSPWGHVYLYDRQARQQWSRFNQYNSATAGEFDGYIVGSYSYDTLDENELLKHALTQLKKQNTPQETFEAQLSDINADIGDYVQIAHSEYNPPLYLKARVEQVENSYTQDGADTGVLGDYTHLQSQIDPRVKDLLNDLENKMKFNYTWIRYASDDKGSDMTSFPTADTKYVAIIPNKQSGVPSDDPKDYEGKWQLIAGIDGKDGVAGEKGADGRTAYTHFAYANDVSGTTDFSVDDPTGRAYMGVYSDFTKADSNNPSDYVWSYTKGETGPEGTQGIPGKPGIDGKTPYTHVAYADDDKGGGFSQSPDNKAYMGWYSDFTQADSNDPSLYGWSLIKGADGKDGADGVAGKDGVGIKSTQIMYAQSTSGTTAPTTGWTAQVPTLIKGQYLWTQTTWVYTDNTGEAGYTVSYNAKDGNTGANGIAGKDGVGIKSTAITYATSASGTSAPTSGWVSTPPSATAGQFIWTRTIWTYTDNTTETGYSVGKIGEKGATGADGANGAPGKPGVDGKTPYFHQAWAGSKDGKVNFSATDPSNRGYLGTYSDFTQADSTDPSKYFWTELVGNLQVGVRNLLKGTADFSNGLNVSGANGMVITDEVYNGNRVVKEPQLTASNSYHDPYVSNTIDVAKGEYYALSFYAKTDAPSMVMRCYFYNPTNTISSINNQGFKSTSSDGLSTFTITNQWKQYWIVWRTNINTTVKRVIIGRREKSLAGSDTGAIFINSPMLVEGNKAVGWQAAPEDTQQQIDTINKGLADTNGKIAAVTKVDAQATAPTNPKKGDQWWVLDAQGKATGFKVWNGTAWADSKIQQSMLNVVSLNAVTITGSTINGSKFTNSFTNVEGSWTWNGVTTIEKGSMIIDAVRNDKIRQSMSIDSNGIIQNTFNANGSTMYATSLNMGSLSMSDATYHANLTPEVLASINSTFTEIKGVNGAAKPAYFGYSGHVCWLLINSMLPVSRTTMYWIPKKFCIRSAQIPIIHLNNGALAVYGNGNVENLSIDNDGVVQNGFITWVY